MSDWLFSEDQVEGERGQYSSDDNGSIIPTEIPGDPRSCEDSEKDHGP